MTAHAEPSANTPARGVHYVLRFHDAARHLIDVEARFVDVATRAQNLLFSLPVWTPGSYMVREYARHVEGVRATCGHGHPLVCTKVRKDQWQVQARQAGDVCLRYRVYARELSVRTNFVNQAMALVQNAATLLGHGPSAHLPHEVSVHLPVAWKSVSCGLPGRQEGREVRFVASDYDALVDSPFLLGNPTRTSFCVSGVDHTLVSVGGEQVFDDPAAVAELRQIVAEVHGLWGQVPYDRYVFMNVLLGGGGGLEHRHSAVVMASPHTRHKPQARADYWGLLAHELFHAWNIKRLRPQALGPFAYDRENPTPSLWIAEGLTAYYDDLVVRRCGLTDDAAYLARLAQTLQSLAATPGQGHHALTEASFDAWIKLYRRDENTDNTTVSYYLKGSIVGFVLDARIRQATAGARSLDDVMRLAYARFSGEVGFAEAEFRALVSEVAGSDQAAWLAEQLDRPGAVDVTAALQAYGLELSWRGKTPAGERAMGLWGVACDEGGGRLVVNRVRRDCSAYEAGLNVGDELLALGDARLPAGKLWHEAVLDLAPPDGKVELLIARFGRLQRLAVQLEEEPAQLATLKLAATASPQQLALRDGWLASCQQKTQRVTA